MKIHDEPILFEQAGGIAHLCFNRPHALNALDRDTALALLGICRKLRDAADVRVVILRGKGRAFMAGGDLGSFHADPTHAADAASAIIEPLHAALEIMTTLPQVVIASLHGAVAGAGVSLALACDLAIAADDTRFNLAYTRIGASPDAGATWSLPQVVGLRKALELVLLAENVDATEAARLGMVNRVVLTAALAEETTLLAQRLAAGPVRAYAHSKRLLRTAANRDFPQQLAAEHQAFRDCAGGAEFTEGVTAFFEKRPARFHLG